MSGLQDVSKADDDVFQQIGLQFEGIAVVHHNIPSCRKADWGYPGPGCQLGAIGPIGQVVAKRNSPFAVLSGRWLAKAADPVQAFDVVRCHVGHTRFGGVGVVRRQFLNW